MSLAFSTFLIFASGTYVSVKSLGSFLALKNLTSSTSEEISGLKGASVSFPSSFFKSKDAKNG